MQSSIIKRFLGILISFVLIVSSLAIVVVYALEYTFAKENMEQVFSAINFGSILKATEQGSYEELQKSAEKLNIKPETLDKILNTDAVTNVIGDCTSSIVLGLFEGKEPAESLATTIEPSMDKNSEEFQNIMYEAIDAAKTTSINELQEQKNNKKITEEQYNAGVQKAEEAATKAKEDSKDSVKQLGSKIQEQIVQNKSFHSLNSGKVAKLATTIKILKIVIIACIFALIILFFFNATSAFWLSMNCLIVAVISFVSTLILKSQTNAICNSFYNKLSSSKLLANMSSSALSQMITFLSDGLRKYALFLFIAAVVCFGVHLLLKPFRDKNELY